MTAILNDLFQAISQEFTELLHHAECRQIALFGMDFLPEDNGRVWLLEANHGPCFPVDDSHPLQSYVYADFWRAVVKEFVEPIAQKRSVSRLQYSEFSRISGL